MFFTFANKKIHVHFVNEQSIYSINMILLRVYFRISYISYIIIYIRITTRAHRFYLNGLVFSLHEIPRNKLLFVFFPCYSLVLTRIHLKWLEVLNHGNSFSSPSCHRGSLLTNKIIRCLPE